MGKTLTELPSDKCNTVASPLFLLYHAFACRLTKRIGLYMLPYACSMRCRKTMPGPDNSTACVKGSTSVGSCPSSCCLAACASQAPGYYKPPAGLNEYAQMQDYLDCHGSWREHACFVERGIRRSQLAPSPRALTHRSHQSHILGHDRAMFIEKPMLLGAPRWSPVL